MTRASVLALCQWSNTQFAYWSRRSEAVSVLACHDSGLRDLFYVLFERLYQRPAPPNAFATYSPATTSTSWSSSTASSCGSPSPSHSKQLSTSQTNQRDVDAVEVERRLRVARAFTGKGLDGVIADVKKRTGASQFLRGRQSSLDPFGAYLTTGAAAYDPNWPVVMPSFHGKQSHSRASSDNYEYLMPSMRAGALSSRPNSALGSPMMSLSRPSYEASNERLYERRLASSMPGYDQDFRFPTRPATSPAGSESPYSRSSTAGSKRKRDESSSSEEEEYAARADMRRPVRPRAVSDFVVARSTIAKRAKRDI